MKTKQELLKFLGVELEKTYVMKGIDSIFHNVKFSVCRDYEDTFGYALQFENSNDKFPLSMLFDCDFEEIKPSTLNDTEREYLQKYVMSNPAFKGKVVRIQKQSDKNGYEGYLAIWLDSEPTVFFPNFELDTMYEGMAENIKYTPKELGLEEK